MMKEGVNERHAKSFKDYSEGDSLMLDEKKLEKLERLAVLLKNHCFERMDDQTLKANYEISSLLVLTLSGFSVLIYGDKSGGLWVKNKINEKEDFIFTEDLEGTIDVLTYITLSEKSALLFVGASYKGTYVYHLKVEGDRLECEGKGPVFEKDEIIRFFYPNIVAEPEQAFRSLEVWVCFDNGDFRIYKSNEPFTGWKETRQEDLDYVLRSCAIEYEGSSGNGHFFLGNSAGDIFCFPFTARKPLVFPEDMGEFEKARILSVHGCSIERMIPLSDFQKNCGGSKGKELFYPEYSGCLIKTDNKAICLYCRKGEEHKNGFHTATKIFQSQLLDIRCLNSGGFCYTVISDNQRRLHLIKNITEMDPPGKEIGVIFDGEYRVLNFDDRIFTFCFVPHRQEQDGDAEWQYQAYFGMGNHVVLPAHVYHYDNKLDEVWRLFQDIVGLAPDGNCDPGGSIETEKKVLNDIEKILGYFRTRPSKTEIKLLMLHLMESLTTKWCKEYKGFLKRHRLPFNRIFYKIIDDEIDGDDDKMLIRKSSEFLYLVEKACPCSPQVISDLQGFVNKFILDKKDYDQKPEKVKELWKYNETTGNFVDALIFQGMLYERQHDPISHIAFGESEGEPIRVVPFKGKFIVGTSAGKIYSANLETGEKTLLYDCNKREDSDSKRNAELKIANIYVGEYKIYLMVHENKIISTDIDGFNQESDLQPIHSIHGGDYGTASCQIPQIPHGTAVCQLPGDERKGDECVVGTNKGEMYHVIPGKKPSKIYSDPLNNTTILDLRSFHSNDRFFLVAACWNGTVKIFEWFLSNEKVKLIQSMPVDAYAVNRIFVFRNKVNYQRHPLIVVGTDSGKCYGIRFYINGDDGRDIHYIYEWGYKCEEAIKAIHPFALEEDYDHILICSRDGNLHILEPNGLSVNTMKFKTPLIQVYIPPIEIQKGEDRIDRDGYIVTIDNKLQKIRFFIKERVMNTLNDSFSGESRAYEKFKGVDEEIMLLKFKSIDIAMNHFKTRYYLKSKSFDSPDHILSEIEFILGNGEFSKKTYALIALIHRFFSQFFEKILKNPQEYARVKRLFIRTCSQWDYPGSQNNTRVQLYWIRSMLRGCHKSGKPIEALNYWYKTGNAVAEEYKILGTDSDTLIKRFIMHPLPFIRLKTLQYLQRFILRPGIQKGIQRSSTLNPELVERITDYVIEVLKRYLVKNIEGSPNWFELEAVRLFVWLVMNNKNTSFSPGKLCYKIWENDIPYSFFFRLSDCILIYPEDVERKDEISEMLRAAGDLVKELQRDNPQVTGIIPNLTAFCNRCIQNQKVTTDNTKINRCKGSVSLEINHFFQTIAGLLAFKNIDDFADLSALEKIDIDENPEYFGGKRIVDDFVDLAGYIKAYRQEKYEDIFLDRLNRIQYTTFYKINKTIHNIRETIPEIGDRYLRIESELYSIVIRQWNDIIEKEMDNNIILDFANAIREYNEQCISYNEPMNMPLIFRNIFTRLSIMAECDGSYLFYYDGDSRKLVMVHNDKEKEQVVKSKSSIPERIPREWLAPDTFLALSEGDIENTFKDSPYRHMIIKEPGIDPIRTSAVYLFSWKEKNSRGISRIERLEILGEFITAAAYLQTALREQQERNEEFLRIVAHELSQIIGGMAAWVSNLLTGHLEDKPKDRWEYYERFRDSLISADHLFHSILSFHDEFRLNLKACYLDEEIRKIVKLARTQYKDYGDIPLELDIMKGEDYEIVTDPSLIGMAVLNLLTNARKYNPHRKPVWLKLSAEAKQIFIEVIDEGMGIPREDYPKVFKKFERGSNALKYNIGGLGIGLEVSKNNIGLVKGTITFESDTRKGTKFKITLNKRAFEKKHALVTKVLVERNPDFDCIKDLDVRKRIMDKVNYNPYKGMLRLRGVLTEKQYNELKICYDNDERTKESNLEALKKLYDESNAKLKQKHYLHNGWPEK